MRDRDIKKPLIKGKRDTLSSNVFESYKGLTFDQFWALNPPVNKITGQPSPIFEYERSILNLLGKKKHIWIKKATGLGISEFMLYFIGWIATRNDDLQGCQICIVTGPRIELAVSLIKRLRDIFKPITFDDKETVAEINGCRIEAFPSHHLDTARGLPRVKLFLLDEGDFFPPGQQQDSKDVSERYIAKSDPWILWVSTPNLPGGLFEEIEKNPNSIYEKVFLPYTVGLGTIYTEEDIAKARKSDSFEREYNLQYGSGLGNIFPYSDLKPCIEEDFDKSLFAGYKGIGVDPAFGSSKFGIVAGEKLDGIIYVKLAEQYERASPSQMLDKLGEMARLYDRNVAVDSAHPGLILDLNEKKGVSAMPIQFNKLLSEMTTTASRAVKEHRVRVHPTLKDLIAQLRAVRFNDKGHPDKSDKKGSTFDMGDAFLMLIYLLDNGQANYALFDEDSNIIAESRPIAESNGSGAVFND